MHDCDEHFQLTFDQIFRRFTEIYWPVVVGNDLQQKVGDGERKSYIEQYLISAADKYGMNKDSMFTDLSEKQQKQIVDSVREKCKLNVVGALYGDTMGVFYSFSLKEEWIRINPLVIHFLMKFADEIQELNYAAWAEFMEKVNGEQGEESIRNQNKKLSIGDHNLYLKLLKSTFMTA